MNAVTGIWVGVVVVWICYWTIRMVLTFPNDLEHAWRCYLLAMGGPFAGLVSTGLWFAVTMIWRVYP